jgi:hypothetical protein
MRLLPVVVAVCVAAPVAARPTRADLKKAREHFRRGERLHEAQRFDEAIREYQAAYKLSGLPDMLYNIGQVLRMRADRRGAIDYYPRYLAAAPNGPGAAKARSFIESLKAEIDAERLAMKDGLGEEWRGVVQGASPEPYIPPLPSRRPRTATDEPPDSARDQGGGLRIAGLITAGAGVLVIGGGVLFAFRARSLSDELDGIGPGDTYDPSLVEDGRAAQRNSVILLGVGSAAIVTGGVLYDLGMGRASDPVVGLAPADGGGLLSVSGRF